MRATDGSEPRLATTVAAYYDDAALTLLFTADDDHVVAEYREHDQPLWQHDVVEAFLAPRSLTEYFEIEVNPLGTTFDARLESPDGNRATMRTFLDWTCEGLSAAIERTSLEGRGVCSTVIRIPFRSLATPPVPEYSWRANFFRIDRHPTLGDEFTAWQPTLRTPADFHVPSAFGTLLFL